MKSIVNEIIPFTFLAVAGLLGGCAGAEPIEGDEVPDGQVDSEREMADAAVLMEAAPKQGSGVESGLTAVGGSITQAEVTSAPTDTPAPGDYDGDGFTDLTVSARNSTTLSSPAVEGTCSTPGCGGEVSNNTNYYVSISNCWADSYGTWENGDNLPCQGNPVRVGNVANARIWLAPGDWSSENQYSAFYDTDAVKFPAGCITYYHWWGGGQLSEDRRGKDSIWRKITSLDHFYYDRISC